MFYLSKNTQFALSQTAPGARKLRAIMRSILAIITIFSFTSSIGQFQKLKGHWISEKNEFISVIDTTNSVNHLSNENLSSNAFYLRTAGDNLIFQIHYYSPKDKFTTLYQDYVLKILTVNDSVLVAKPMSKHSKDFFHTEEPIHFKRQELIKDKDFKLDQLIFHASTCFGRCPEINLQISNDRTIRINSRFAKDEFHPDENRSGTFIGQLDPAVFDNLIDLIIQSRITTFDLANQDLCCDGVVKTIIITHNGKRSYVKAMFEPIFLKSLLSFLYEIDQKTPLKRVKENFRFED
jgi:hypothetical protein